MKWLLALLIAANIGFYLWAGGRGARGEQSGAPPGAAEGNREGMLLLQERAGNGRPENAASGEAL